MGTIKYNTVGNVFDIQRFSIHDGPGIRTIAFLKGCPLSCLWCCNPESQKLEPVLLYSGELCMHCTKCVSACRQGAITGQSERPIDRSKCIACGECVRICPTGALSIKGRKMSVEMLIKELKKDVTAFRKSGGGITVSGGEPLVQAEFAAELLKGCKAQGWHTAMETTGYGSGEAVEKVFPYVDLVLLDIKAIDDEVHQRVTGVSNRKILENAKRISEITQVVVRVPTIPGVNASTAEYEKICAFVKTLDKVDTLHLLPYHTYGENKYGLLDMDYPMGDQETLSDEEIEALRQLVEARGLRCVIGG